MTELKIHPTAARFPALSEPELEEMAADIKANGQRQAIMLTADGKTLVDGVNRYKACKRAGVPPKTARLPQHYTEIDILQFIMSVNLRRRDLNAGQRALLVLDFAEHFEKAAKERRIEAGRRGSAAVKGKRFSAHGRSSIKKKKIRKTPPHNTRDDLGKLAKVAGRTVSTAKAVRLYSKALADRVLSGEIGLDAAEDIMRKEKAAQPRPEGGMAFSNKVTILVTHEGRTAAYPLPRGRIQFNTTNDQVSWAAYTWNPVAGCLHNCNYCYAREGIVINHNLRKHYPFGFEPTFFEYRLRAPANSKLPKEAMTDPRYGRVFVSSMGDLFGKWVPEKWIEKVFAACAEAPWWEYLFLTKFPQRYVGLQLPSTAWIGTTVDVQDRVKIAETAFRKIDGVRVKWLSCEPLLEPLKFHDLSMFDFVVIGSQSATKQPKGNGSVLVPEFAPPFEWVADLTAQAKAAGCKVYHKPNLLGVPNDQCAGMKLIQEVPDLSVLPAQGDMFGEAAE